MATESGNLLETLHPLRWRWKLLLLVALPVALGAAMYAEGLPATYQAEALVSIEPRPDLSSPDADLVRLGAPKYVDYITADATIERVASRIAEDVSEVDDGLDASVASDTGILSITVTLPDPRRAARVANAFAADALTYARSDALLTAYSIAPATVPGAPSGPPRTLIEAAALFVGLLLGLGAALAQERLRPRIRTWRDIAMLTGYPMVGRLPASRVLRSAPPVALADGAVGSAIRVLRTNLDRTWGGQVHGTILVTSATESQGKTTIAALLATAFAQLGTRVLLVDADLRRSSLSRGLGAGPTGLSSVLTGRATLTECLRPGWVANLSVLTTASDQNAGDLLARRFGHVLQEARELFDLVIVDSPPVMGTDDAPTMATRVDAVLFVVSAGSLATPVSESVLSLHSLKVRVAGVVANRLRDDAPTANYAYADAGR